MAEQELVFMPTMHMHDHKMESHDDQNNNNNNMVQWDKFLPRMVLRVLLVEADDSTRHVISALLRKCSYKVAAVSDGLKAWETLNRKSSEIDLILTEVELPSISGFALLTLIMEHDTCKNIPVIMMSNHDSVSLSMKCILKGASDFLIKPVRRNELRNLWQHVWRRHEISPQPQTLPFPQKKLETTSENNAASNDSSGSVASTQKNNGRHEKGSEAQSTCTSPFLEAESACMQNMQDTSNLKSSSNLSNIDTVQNEESNILGSEKQSIKHIDENPNMDTNIHGYNNELVESSRGAIDLIATFNNLPVNGYESCNLSGAAKKFDFDPRLELSLRQEFPGSSSKQTIDEKQALNHSKASAFSLYSGCKSPSPSGNFAKAAVHDVKSYEASKLSRNVDTSHHHGGTNHRSENMATPAIGQSDQAEIQLPNSQPGPLLTTTKDDSPSPIITSNSFQSNPESHNPEQGFHGSDDAANTCHDKTANEESNLDTMRQYSSAVDQCTSNASCHDIDTANQNNKDGNSNYAYKLACNVDGNASSAAVIESNHENHGDSDHQTNDGFRGTDSHCPSHREAALTKFRMKRKERCFEKKVRYLSRKRLAEARPRVKGQFVRQVHNTDHSVADVDVGS